MDLLTRAACKRSRDGPGMFTTVVITSKLISLTRIRHALRHTRPLRQI